MGKGGIAITGMGIVSAIGNNSSEVLESLLKGESGIGEPRYLQSVHKELPVGEVKLSNEEIKHRLNISSEQIVSRTTLLGMLALEEALASSYITKKDRPKRTIFVNGTTVAGMDITEQYFSEMVHHHSHLDLLRSHDCGSCTSAIAQHAGLFSDYTTVSTACSSALNAIIIGARLIQAGEADIVVAGGCEALSRFHLNGFKSLMILDHERCRPFDATRVGLNLGEGAAYLVMESANSAMKRGASIFGYLSGWGNACDAFHQTASSDNGEGACRAMGEALHTADVSSSQIDYINAHGTGTPNNDISESAALKRIFGDNLPAISSTKAFTGHTTSAAGSIDAVIALLAMRHNFVPANLGFSQPIPDGIVPSTGQRGCQLHHVMCNAFGFGGNDSSIIISDRPTSAKTPRIDESMIVEIAGRCEIDSEEELSGLHEFIAPMEARRMNKLMKSSLLSSLRAMHEAGVDKPDAIITATAWGNIDYSERLLYQLEEGEDMLKPTWFMQSTHNTIGSNIAIRLGCHGYNITYTQGPQSLQWALRDAHQLLQSGQCRTVLVGCHDEATPLFRELMQSLGCEAPLHSIHSLALLLTCGN